MAMGSQIKTEKLRYKAVQKLFGRSISVRDPQLLSILIRKAASAGGQVVEFNTGRRSCCKCAYAGKSTRSDSRNAFMLATAV